MAQRNVSLDEFEQALVQAVRSARSTRDTAWALSDPLPGGARVKVVVHVTGAGLEIFVRSKVGDLADIKRA